MRFGVQGFGVASRVYFEVQGLRLRELEFLQALGVVVCGPKSPPAVARPTRRASVGPPKKHLSKNEDEDIPYTPFYNETHYGRDIPIQGLCLCPLWFPRRGLLEPAGAVQVTPVSFAVAQLQAARLALLS